MWSRVYGRLRPHPDLLGRVLPDVLQFLQLRYMYEQSDMWEPALTRMTSPPLTEAVLPPEGVRSLARA